MTEDARFVLLLVGLALLVAALFAWSLLTGPANIGVSDSLRALFSGEGDAIVLVMREIRLPRALLALLIGASLGLSGLHCKVIYETRWLNLDCSASVLQLRLAQSSPFIQGCLCCFPWPCRCLRWPVHSRRSFSSSFWPGAMPERWRSFWLVSL